MTYFSKKVCVNRVFTFRINSTKIETEYQIGIRRCRRIFADVIFFKQCLKFVLILHTVVMP